MMKPATLEHLNFTATESGSRRLIKLCRVIRLENPLERALAGRRVRRYHVGTDDLYLAIYSPRAGARGTPGKLHRSRVVSTIM